MLQMLPLDSYTWNDTKTLVEVLNTGDDSDFGFFVEVDLEYPPELRDQHNDLLPAPEKLPIQQSWLSWLWNETLERFGCDEKVDRDAIL